MIVLHVNDLLHKQSYFLKASREIGRKPKLGTGINSIKHVRNFYD